MCFMCLMCYERCDRYDSDLNSFTMLLFFFSKYYKTIVNFLEFVFVLCGPMFHLRAAEISGRSTQRNKILCQCCNRRFQGLDRVLVESVQGKWSDFLVRVYWAFGSSQCSSINTSCSCRNCFFICAFLLV